MTTFILSQEPSMERNGKESESGRVILDHKAHGPVIGAIKAEALRDKKGNIIQSAWCVARKKVDEPKFYHIVNVGWFSRLPAEQVAA